MSNAMRVASYIALVVLSLGVAAYAVLTYALLPLGLRLPREMRAVFETYPLAIYGHVFASAIALTLGPFQFASRLRSRLPRVHRWLGRLYLGAGVLVGGLAGLFMSFHAFGGLLSRLGFALLAAAWLATGLLAYRAIRVRDIAAHRRWMIRNFSLTFAAVTLRIYVPASIASGMAFELAYPVIAWLCWVPNLLLAEMLFNMTHHPSIQRTA